VRVAVVERVFHPPAHLGIVLQRRESRKDPGEIEPAVYASQVPQTGPRRTPHVRAAVSEEGETRLLNPVPIGVM
jgi:hypothetical protein